MVIFCTPYYITSDILTYHKIYNTSLHNKKLSTELRRLCPLRNKPFKNNMGKGENASTCIFSFPKDVLKPNQQAGKRKQKQSVRSLAIIGLFGDGLNCWPLAEVKHLIYTDLFVKLCNVYNLTWQVTKPTDFLYADPKLYPFTSQ